MKHKTIATSMQISGSQVFWASDTREFFCIDIPKISFTPHHIHRFALIRSLVIVDQECVPTVTSVFVIAQQVFQQWNHNFNYIVKMFLVMQNRREGQRDVGGPIKCSSHMAEHEELPSATFFDGKHLTK